MPAMQHATQQRFWAKVEPTGFCWLWTGGRSTAGYGTFNLTPGCGLAHRLSYELLAGPIPAGLQLDHLCRVRHCVNPDHLEPVTPRENIRRSPVGAAQRTACPQGHEYTPENTFTRTWSGSEGVHLHRDCRECARLRAARNRARRAAA